RPAWTRPRSGALRSGIATRWRFRIPEGAAPTREREWQQRWKQSDTEPRQRGRTEAAGTMSWEFRESTYQRASPESIEPPESVCSGRGQTQPDLPALAGLLRRGAGPAL